MPIYDKPVHALMKQMTSDLGMKHGETISKDRVRQWFAEHFPKIKGGTIAAHLIRLSTNARTRLHYNAKPDDDIFFQVDGSHFRLFDPASDPPPIRPAESDISGIGLDEDERNGDTTPDGASEFAYERDLRNFLSKNLPIIEPGLVLYEEEDVNGIEFPAGGRFIDILAVDTQSGYVVIELKVSRGHDRVLGQLRRYMGWIVRDQAEPGQRVRGIIVAREISEDLMLACMGLPDVELFEYELSIAVRRVSGLQAPGKTV